MRVLFAVIVAVTLSACGAASVTTLSVSALTPPGVRSCLVRELTRMNYTVVGGDQDPTTVTAEKKLSGALSVALTQTTYWNVIVAVISPARSNRAAMELTLHIDQKQLLRKRTDKGIAVTGQLKKDGESLQRACR